MAEPEDEQEVKKLFNHLEQMRELEHEKIEELDQQIEAAKRKQLEKLPESRGAGDPAAP